MVDFLEALARDARSSIDEGYYDVEPIFSPRHLDFKGAILRSRKVAIIAEVKFASPIRGIIREDMDAVSAARAMVKGGAAALSVLTEPRHFKGSIEGFIRIRGEVPLPLLMKDVIISREQLDAASKIGADAVLLISALFRRGYCEEDIEGMISYAHSRGLQVLLETYSEEEFLHALQREADMVGINNRDLKTMNVDLDLTRRILEKSSPGKKVVVSESGIESARDIRQLMKYGVKAFLIGSSIMSSENIEEAVKEFVDACQGSS